MREQVELERTEKLHRIFVGVLQDIFYLPYPLVQFAVVRLAGLVFPVRGVTPFGYLVHAVGTNLHFYPFAVLTHHGHVQRLITVRFRHRDPISYALRVGTIELGDGGVDHPALVFLAHRLIRGEDDTHRQEIIHVLKSALLSHHLLPYRIDGFDTRFEGELISHAGQPFANRNTELLETIHLLLLDGLQFVMYLLPCLGVLVFETQVLQLRLDGE